MSQLAQTAIFLVATACTPAPALPISSPDVEAVCQDSNDATCSSDWALCWNACADRHWGDDVLDSWCGEYPVCSEESCDRFVGVSWRSVR